MKHLKQLLVLVLVNLLFLSLTACEKDEGLLPDISLKTGGNYISTDVTRPAGSTITIGINAAKTEDKDVLKKFNISKSINGGTATSVLNQDLTSSEEDSFSYDYITTLENTPGQVNRYIFTITNRDGLTNQVTVQVSIQ